MLHCLYVKVHFYIRIVLVKFLIMLTFMFYLLSKWIVISTFEEKKRILISIGSNISRIITVCGDMALRSLCFPTTVGKELSRDPSATRSALVVNLSTALMTSFTDGEAMMTSSQCGGHDVLRRRFSSTGESVISHSRLVDQTFLKMFSKSVF